jgi:TonB family protein
MDNQVSKESEDRWINERLASLNPPANWQPHADRAFERVMQRQSTGRRQKWIRLTIAGAAFASAGLIVTALPWNTLWTPEHEEPLNKTLPVQARQDPAPAFAAEIKVVPAEISNSSAAGTRGAMATAAPPQQALIFKPIPPLPEVPPTEAEFPSQGFPAKKAGQPPRALMAEAAAGGPQESSKAGVTEPVAISMTQPAYTKEAREAKITGTVELVCTIHTDGSVTVEQVAKGLGYGLDEAARDAASQWKFIPAKKDGVPVSTVVNILVNFSLRK